MEKENEFILKALVDNQRGYIQDLEYLDEGYPALYKKDLNVAHDELYNLEYRLRVATGEVVDE